MAKNCNDGYEGMIEYGGLAKTFTPATISTTRGDLTLGKYYIRPMPRCNLRKAMPFFLVGVAAVTLMGCQRQLTNTNKAAPSPSPSPMVKADVLDAVDTAKSDVAFDFTSKFHNGSGRFSRFIAEGSFNRTDPTQLQLTLTMDTSSIATGIAVRDTHLKSKDFFAVEQYPTLTYRVTEAKFSADGKQFNVTGDLTIRGKTLPVTAPVSILENPDGSVTLKGSLTINRREWGSFKYDESSPINPVGDQIPIHLSIVFANEP